MTLQEMVKGIEGTSGNRFQATQYQILRMLDLAQKAAFNHDCRAFEKRATLLTINNTILLGRINLTSEDIGDMTSPGLNGKLTNAATAITAIEKIKTKSSLLSSDGILYVVISRPNATTVIWQEQERKFAVFPSDCRIIKEVFARNFEIDNFARKITSFVPRDTLVVSYYRKPSDLAYESKDEHGDVTFLPEEESGVIIPNEWRWTVLVQPAIAMLDSKQYGDNSQQAYLESYFREFWAAMDSRRNDGERPVSVGAWL